MRDIDALGAPGYETIAIASLSDAGLVRADNQDALAVLENTSRERLMIVADGMGGHRGGETASRICLETVERVFREPHGTPEERLRRSLELANEEIYSHALENTELRGMGTTAVAVVLAPDGGAFVAWVGDSRCYRLRDRVLEPLTRDHSLMSEWISLGVITSEGAKTHPRRHELMRALGQSPDVLVEQVAIDLRPGDRLLLCSDGLHGYVRERTLALALGSGTPAEASAALVKAANAVGGSDNVSVVVALVSEAPSGELVAEPSPDVATEPVVESEASFADLATEIAEVVPDSSDPVEAGATDAGAPEIGSLPEFLPPSEQEIQIPLMTPVRSQRGLDLLSVFVGVCAALVLVATGFGVWSYTTRSTPIVESRAPRPRPALARPTPPAPTPASPQVAKPEVAPTPAPAPAKQIAKREVRKPDPAPTPAPKAPAPAAVPDVPAAPAPAIEETAPSFSGFELTPPVERFLTEWIGALASGDRLRLEALGFRDEPAELAGTLTTRDDFRLVAAEIDEERSQAGRVYLRLIVSYAFRDPSGRFRTQDEQRFILNEDAGRLRFEGRWRQ